MKLKPVHLLVSLTLLLALALSAQPNKAQSLTKLQIGYTVWVGYGPLFIARDKGYFKDAGLDVELVKVDDPKDRFAALAGNKLDGLVTTLDTMSLYWRPETPFKAILGLDELSGGDGIVANGDIKTVKDLKGKNVGVNVGTVSQFFLEYVLQQNAMSSADMTLVKMKQGDVPAALAANRIDAGVTWEPNLTKSIKTGSHMVISSKDTPGLIVDVLLLRGDVLDKGPDVAKGLVAAWNKSIEYWKASPDDADAVMQKGLGGFYETPDDIKADLMGATLFDADHNARFFAGKVTDPGSALATLKFAIDFYTKGGSITIPLKLEDLIDASYVTPVMAATPAATASK